MKKYITLVVSLICTIPAIAGAHSMTVVGPNADKYKIVYSPGIHVPADPNAKLTPPVIVSPNVPGNSTFYTPQIRVNGKQVGPTQLICTTGPITQNFGGAPYSVYSCNDHYSLFVVAPTNSPAAPRAFLYTRVGNGFSVNTVGTGNPELSNAGFRALRQLTRTQLNTIVAQTKAALPATTSGK